MGRRIRRELASLALAAAVAAARPCRRRCRRRSVLLLRPLPPRRQERRLRCLCHGEAVVAIAAAFAAVFHGFACPEELRGARCPGVVVAAAVGAAVAPPLFVSSSSSSRLCVSRRGPPECPG